MEEIINALKSENESLKQTLEQTNAERIAIDQLYVETLKQSISSRKSLILIENAYKKLEVQNASFKEEIKKLNESKEEKQPIIIDEVVADVSLEDDAA